MQTPWLVWIFGLLLPPMVAFLYAASVLGMYAGFYEFGVMEKAPALAWRLVMLAGAAAVVYSDRTAIAFGSDISDTNRILMMALQSALLWVLSVYFCFETRMEDVVGGPNPIARWQRIIDDAAAIEEEEDDKDKKKKPTPMKPKKEELLKDKIVLITGANAGIGKETARQLAELGASKIILACRSSKRGQEAVEDLRQHAQEQHDQKQQPKTVVASQFIVLECDLGSFDSVRKAVDTLKDRQLKDIPQIDILILNAGVMMNELTFTKDKLETTMQANLLGHFLLTRLLMEKKLMKPNKENPPRVLHLTSSTYMIALASHGKMDFEDLMCDKNKRKYTLFGQYAQSKLGNILFAKELARRYEGTLISLAIHPGIVRTDVTRNMPMYLKYPNQWLGGIVQQYQKSVAQGAWCTVAGAILPVDASVRGSWEMDDMIMQEAAGEDTGEAEKKDDNNKITKGSMPNGSYLQNGRVRVSDPYTYEEPVCPRETNQKCLLPQDCLLVKA